MLVKVWTAQSLKFCKNLSGWCYVSENKWYGRGATLHHPGCTVCISFCVFFNPKKIWQESKEILFNEVQATCTSGTTNEWNVINDKNARWTFCRDAPLRAADADERIRLKEWEALSAEKLKDGSSELCTQPAKMALLRALQKPVSVETMSNTCWFSHEIFFGSSRKRGHQTKPPQKLIVAKILPTGWKSSSQLIQIKEVGSPAFQGSCCTEVPSGTPEQGLLLLSSSLQAPV